MSAITDTIRQGIGEFIALRHELHAQPELGLNEFRTSERIAGLLEGWGYRVTRGLATTGLVAQLSRGDGDRQLGLRADMDALPIHEATGLPYASRVEGVMHACGHDGHVAMLLAAAHHLAAHGRFNGTLNLIFQPAEEEPGGARLMIEDGLFERFPCDAVFAMHNMPGFAAGDLVFIDGPAMASCDDVTITLLGTGGHAASPHRAADPVVAAASLVLALQTIVTRNIDPRQTATLNIGAIHAGTANNVIPDKATLEISIRTLDREVRKRIEERLRSMVDAQAASFGLLGHVDFRAGYPVLANTPAETALARRVAEQLVGADHVLASPPILGSEDFAFMLERCPGCYLMIGNGAGEAACMVHNPGYDFNDRVLPTGASYWVRLAEACLRPRA